MLRAMVFENFVHFKDRFTLDFSKNKDKPYFFIGASSTGKTAVLELIRRCMNSKLNTSLTNRFDVTKTAYVFCQFEVQDDENIFGSNAITGYILESKNKEPNKEQETALQEENANWGDLLEISVDENDGEDNKDGIKHTLPTDENIQGNKNKDRMGMNKSSKEEDEVNIKNEKREETNQDIRVEKEEKESSKKEEEENMDEESEETDEDNTVKNEEQEGDIIFHKIIIYTSGGVVRVRSKTFFKHREDIIDSKRNVKIPTDGLLECLDFDDNLRKINQNFVEKILKKIRDEQSRGNTYKRYPKLWDKISETYVGILSMRGVGTFQWTRSEQIEEKHKAKNYTEVCKQAEIINELLDSASINPDEEETFRFLTSPNAVRFVKKGDEIVVKHDNDKEFPLLKTSVGVFEAKQFSLVFSDKRFKTICYEEPERGMHPQMIERMKEKLHQKCRDKTVIIVTHSPVFIDSLSIRNTFVFYRKESSEHCICGLKALDSAENYSKVQKLSQDETLKKLLLSSRILLVEGKTDKVVIEAIFRHICANQIPLENLHKIISHQVIQLGGCANAEDIQAVCKEIHLPCRILSDRDSYVNLDGQGLVEGFKDTIQGFRKFKERSIGEFLKKKDGFQELSKELESKDVFMWKYGELEDVLLGKNNDCRKKLLKTLGIEKPEKKSRKQLKKAIKDRLTDEISQTNYEILGEILHDFDETKRLLGFLAR